MKGPQQMDRPTQLTIELLDDLLDRDADAAQALADTIIPCLIRGLYAAMPTFIQTVGQCILEQMKQPGYNPAPDQRCENPNQ